MMWTKADWQGLYAERSAIAEYDGGVSRKTAHTLAYASCIREWLDQNPTGVYNEAVEALAAMNINKEKT